MTHLVMHTDGGSRGNPGASAAGIFLPQSGTRIGVWLGDDKTNNEAEYSALIHGLKSIRVISELHLEVRADSQLMVKQMRGEYAVRSESLFQYWSYASELAQRFPLVTYTYVPRAQNAEADAIANEIMDRVAAGEKIPCYQPQILS
jgi:ribonuclease HI